MRGPMIVVVFFVRTRPTRPVRIARRGASESVLQGWAELAWSELHFTAPVTLALMQRRERLVPPAPFRMLRLPLRCSIAHWRVSDFRGYCLICWSEWEGESNLSILVDIVRGASRFLVPLCFILCMRGGGGESVSRRVIVDVTLH